MNRALQAQIKRGKFVLVETADGIYAFPWNQVSATDIYRLINQFRSPFCSGIDVSQTTLGPLLRDPFIFSVDIVENAYGIKDRNDNWRAFATREEAVQFIEFEHTTGD